MVSSEWVLLFRCHNQSRLLAGWCPRNYSSLQDKCRPSRWWSGHCACTQSLNQHHFTAMDCMPQSIHPKMSMHHAQFTTLSQALQCLMFMSPHQASCPVNLQAKPSHVLVQSYQFAQVMQLTLAVMLLSLLSWKWTCKKDWRFI